MNYNRDPPPNFSEAIMLIKNSITTETTIRMPFKVALRYGRQHKTKVEMLLMLPPKFKDIHIQTTRNKSQLKSNLELTEEDVGVEVEWLTRPALDVTNRMAQISRECKADTSKVLLTATELDWVASWNGTTMKNLDESALKYAKKYLATSNSSKQNKIVNTWLEAISLASMATVLSATQYTVEFCGGPFVTLKFAVSGTKPNGGGDSLRLFNILLLVHRDLEYTVAKRTARDQGLSIKWDSVFIKMEDERKEPEVLHDIRALGRRLYTKVDNVLQHRSVDNETPGLKVPELHSVDDSDLKEVLEEVRRRIRRSV